MSKIKKTPTEAKRDLENWWYKNYQEFVTITADDEEGFITIEGKDGGAIYGLDTLGQWCAYHDYGVWASYNIVKHCPQVVISI